jgi:hypothetical protein
MPDRPLNLQVNDAFSPARPTEQAGSLGEDETHEVETVVFALIPEFEQVKVRDDAGHIYALTPMTRGVDLVALHEGQRIVCTVTHRLPRVLSAKAVA